MIIVDNKKQYKLKKINIKETIYLLDDIMIHRYEGDIYGKFYYRCNE